MNRINWREYYQFLERRIIERHSDVITSEHRYFKHNKIQHGNIAERLSVKLTFLGNVQYYSRKTLNSSLCVR